MFRPKLRVSHYARHCSDVAAAIAAADAMIGDGVLPVASASGADAIFALIKALTDFKEGTTGPPRLLWLI